MKKALGKGLSALIPDSYAERLKPVAAAPQTSAPAAGAGEKKTESSFQMIPLIQIKPNHDQPRKEFDPEAIEDLAASIREKGILQPVVVKRSANNQFELICGERRMRAALLCGLTEIPAVIKDIADSDFLEWALIENIQREDLNPLEEALAYEKLVQDQMVSQEEVAKRVGKSRVAITNTMRLLRLPEEVRQWVATGQLAAGHARAILGLPTPEHQRQLAKRVVEDGLSARQTEAIVNRSNAHRRKPKNARYLKPEIVDLERRLAEYLGTQVKVYPRKNLKQGRMEVHYFSLDDLDRILDKIGLSKHFS